MYTLTLPGKICHVQWNSRPRRVRTADLRVIFLAGMTTIASGCGHPPEQPLALDPPNVSLVEPRNGAFFKPGAPIKFSGRVTANGTDGVPGVVVIKIAADKRWSDILDSYATPIVRSEPTGTYSFEAIRTAPLRPGKYYAQAKSDIQDGILPSSSQGRAAEKQVSPPFVEIEVRR